MSDESGSFLAKFIAHAGPKYARKGAAANAVVIGVVLPVSYLVINTAEPGSVSDTIAAYFPWTIAYATASLFAMAHLVVKRQFITPEVKQPTCHYCGGPMTTISLKCENCYSKSNKGE